MSQILVTGEAKIRDIQGPVVANSGVVTALDGDASQYVRGDGTLADFPTSTGGGSSVSYYLNSSVSQGTIGGVAYRQLSKTPISGAGTDITASTNGYIASYLTDANDPALLEVPAGNFNCEFYFSVNNNTGNPFVYAEIYKYDGAAFTLLGTSVGVPEYITEGTVINPYYFAVPVAVAALTITDRLAIRIYVNVDGRVVTLHTENNHLCQVVTTFSKGLISLNNLTRQNQFFGTGTSGTDFNISSSTATHTFNIPDASASNRGLITTGSQTIAGAKTFSNNVNLNSQLFINGGTGYGGGVSYRQGGILSTSDSSTTTEFPDANSIKYYVGQGSNTYKNFVFDVNFITLNATRTYSLPDATGTLALLEGTQTFTGSVNVLGSLGTKYGISIEKGNTPSPLSYNDIFIYASSGGTNIINFANSSYITSFSFPTSNQTYTFPASSGTIALTSNLSSYVPYSGATGAVDLGTNQLTCGNAKINDTLYLKVATTSAHVSGYYGIQVGTNIFVITNSASTQAVFSLASLTTSRTFTLPDSSGTLALTSDLSSYVPYTGATGAVNLGFNLLTTNSINLDGNSVSGVLNIKSNSSITTSGAGYVSLVSGNVNQLSFVFNGGNSATFTSVSLSASRTYSLPDAGGTIALTSDLSAYLPLAGGTLTGALSGTSATFSGALTLNTPVGGVAQKIYAYTDGYGVIRYFTNASVAKWQTGIDNSNSYFIYNEATASNNLTIASTGDATFSSSVTTTQLITKSGSGAAALFLKDASAVDKWEIGHLSNSLYFYNYTTSTTAMTISDSGNTTLTLGTTGEVPTIKAGGTNTDLSIQSVGSGGFIEFVTNASPRMYITSAGNVGIGTSSPITAGATYVGLNISGATGSSLVLTSGSSHTYLYAVNATNDFAIENAGSQLFRAGSAERMRITSAGNTQPGTDNAYSLGVSGTRWSAVWAANGTIQTSDEREKKDIIESDLGLDFVCKLRPVSFKWKIGKNEVTTQIVKDEEGNPILDDEGNEKTESVITPIEGKRTHYGLIAQEVEELLDGKDFGGFIHDDKTDIKGLRYDQFVPLLIKSIQELQAKIVTLESKIN